MQYHKDDIQQHFNYHKKHHIAHIPFSSPDLPVLCCHGAEITISKNEAKCTANGTQ
jgi:hypothetical protein